MVALLRNIPACLLLAIAFVGCSTLAPESSIHINSDPIVSWNDVREIERLLPSLGIKYPITEITPKGPDRFIIICTIRPPYGDPYTPSDEIEFTVVRKDGHWVVAGRPQRISRVITS
jgi:hypothetical protein